MEEKKYQKPVTKKLADIERELCEVLPQLPQELGIKELGDFSLNFEVNFVLKNGKTTINLQESIEKAFSSFLEIRPQEGRVFCYFCRDFFCSHSKPNKITEVFIGYDFRGIPQYSEFHQFLLEKKVERVEELFGKSPPILSHFQYGKELTKELLPSFAQGKKRFQILAQVVLGYLGKKETRLALTTQVVKTPFSLYVNTLHYEWLLEEENPKSLSFEKTVLGILHALRNKISQWDKLPKEINKKVFPELPKVLREFQKDIEALNRRETRRTKHAQLRRLEKRPIAQALQDLEEAGPEDFFQDEQKNSYVIKGPKNRFHIFSEMGKHITSLFLEKSSFEKRLKKGRWKPFLGDIQNLRHKILQNSLTK